jgi:hypothetical protein
VEQHATYTTTRTVSILQQFWEHPDGNEVCGDMFKPANGTWRDIPKVDTTPPTQPAPCTWTKSNDPSTPDTYSATCGAMWTFTDGGPTENNMRFCPECGKPAEQKGQS